MRVVQVSFFVDPGRRAPGDLLEAWDGLTLPAEAAARTGCEVTVVQAAASDAEILHGGVRYRFVAEPGPSPLRRRLGRWAAPLTPAVLAAVAAARPQVAHVHGLSFPRHVARLRAARPGVPLLLQDHADRPPPAWRRRAWRRQMGGAAGVLFTAREQAAPFLRTGALRADIPVFEVPESSSRFTPGATDAERAGLGAAGDPLLVWVGHLDANKDPLTVLRALALAVPTLPDARLYMCWGEAPALARVEAELAADPQLAARVTLLGRRPHGEVERWLRAADFLVLGSHREGSGYAVIEALACGATPLVTDIPSFRRLTGSGAAGALSPPGDAPAMARALVEWAARPRGALRAAARAHFERELSPEALGARLRAAYEAAAEVAAAGTRGRGAAAPPHFGASQPGLPAR